MSNTSTFTLDKATKKEWIKRLRSGEYNQITGVLFGHKGLDETVEAYCCLGVLCEIEGVEKYDMKDLGLPTDVGVGEALTFEEFVVLAGEKAANRIDGTKSFGDEYSYAIKHPKYGWISLAELNDEKGLSFKQIADLVEKYVETH